MRKAERKKKYPSGELRKSQLITTYGPGAMIDLPEKAVLVSGLKYWSDGGRRRIEEERLSSHLARVLNHEGLLDLYEPPVEELDDSYARIGISAILFPLWFLGPVLDDDYRVNGMKYRTRPLVHWNNLENGRYRMGNRKTVKVVPIRFVGACERGHLTDIDWHAFVHDDYKTKYRGELYLDEAGASNEIGDVWVRCGLTGKRRCLVEAYKEHALHRCSGHRPWLGDRDPVKCPHYLRLLVRSASHAWFSQTVSVITIPDRDLDLREAVTSLWDDYLSDATDEGMFQSIMKMKKVREILKDYKRDAIYREVQRRLDGQLTEHKKIKQVEIETLLSQELEIGEDIPDAHFYARARALDDLPAHLAGTIHRIVLVHRLREVMALLGFTRFESAATDIDGELDMNVTSAPLADPLEWLPAIENKGEGVFIAFKPEAIETWLQRSETEQRVQLLKEGFEQWCLLKGLEDAEFPGGAYYMLHSLAHMLITAVSLECGYPASSIRERVYTGESGHGILLYTGGSGSEGTLGGLVDVGRKIEYHLERALAIGRLCSNDPICAQHNPKSEEERFLHGAACHGCLLIAETCCERRNELLDRALVVPTLDCPDAAFFTHEFLL